MTIEELVGKSADELEKMSDAQLMEYFTPYLQHVRPTTIAQKAAMLQPKTKNKEKNEMLRKAQIALDLLEKIK